MAPANRGRLPPQTRPNHRLESSPEPRRTESGNRRRCRSRASEPTWQPETRIRSKYPAGNLQRAPRKGHSTALRRCCPSRWIFTSPPERSLFRMRRAQSAGERKLRREKPDSRQIIYCSCDVLLSDKPVLSTDCFPNIGLKIITEPGSLEDSPCLERDKLSNRPAQHGRVSAAIAITIGNYLFNPTTAPPTVETTE